jgi:hypothetical protein
VKNAIDTNPDTAWTTETYQTTPVIQDSVGKPGVGLIVGTKKPVIARTMTIRSEEGGWDARVYGSLSQPASLAEWGSPIGTISDAGTDETIQLNGAKASNFLIWITKLSPTSVAGGYDVEIDEVTLNS